MKNLVAVFANCKPILAPNGSLWTITVELEFYIAIPIIYYFVQKIGRTNLALAIVAVLSYAVNIYAATLDKTQTLRVLLNVSVLPYLFYFVAGIALFKNYHLLYKYVEGKAGWWIGGYILYYLVFAWQLNWYQVAQDTYFPNFFCLVGYAILSVATISAAVTLPSLSHTLLRGNDISYGYYVYHMVVMNVLVQLHLTGHFYYVLVLLFATALLAYLSWVFVEKPALNLKKTSLKAA